MSFQLAGNHAAYQESSLVISIFFVFLGQGVQGSKRAQQSGHRVWGSFHGSQRPQIRHPDLPK